MVFSSNFLGVFFALTSAAVWGSGDFTGGYATRRDNQYAVLVVSAAVGLVVLVIAALVLREPFPSLPGIIWAALAGFSGAVGIAALYRALSIGHAASVAPTTAVFAAGLPVLFSVITHGTPAFIRMVGFGLALVGLWLVSASAVGGSAASHREVALSVLAGVGFGGFFIFLSLVERGRIFTPLIVSRSMTVLLGLVLLKANRLPFPSFTSNRFSLLAGILDAGGNLFFVLANQYTSLDIVAVLSSLYPASTVLLSSLILKEKITPARWVGVVTCLAAIALITV